MRASSPIPELSRYFNSLRLRTMYLWPSLRRRETFSRRTPTSKKVRRPRRSMREACGVKAAWNERRTLSGDYLLAHDDAQTASPTLRQADARAFEFGREIAEKNVRGGMEAKRRSNQIDERRSGL